MVWSKISKKAQSWTVITAYHKASKMVEIGYNDGMDLGIKDGLELSSDDGKDLGMAVSIELASNHDMEKASKI